MTSSVLGRGRVREGMKHLSCAWDTLPALQVLRGWSLQLGPSASLISGLWLDGVTEVTRQRLEGRRGEVGCLFPAPLTAHPGLSAAVSSACGHCSCQAAPLPARFWSLSFVLDLQTSAQLQFPTVTRPGMLPHSLE